MMHFFCTAKQVNETDIIIGIGELIAKKSAKFYKETMTCRSTKPEHIQLLAIFKTLRKIEELEIEQAFIYHNANAFQTKDLKKSNHYGQLVAIQKRVERMRKKGYRVQFHLFKQKQGKRIVGLRDRTHAYINKQLKPSKIVPIRSTLSVESHPEITFNTKLSSTKQVLEQHKKENFHVLVDQYNHVIDYLTPKQISSLVKKKKVRKINEYSYRHSDYTYETHREIAWLNVKQLHVSKWKLKLDSSLPFSLRQYTKMLTHDGETIFVLTKQVAETLVKEACAKYITSKKDMILLLYTANELRSLVLKRDKLTCGYCRKKTNITLEHVHPKVKGGLTTPKNCIAACSNCNSTKSDRDIKEYYTFLVEKSNSSKAN
mgnify:CR=1 FL=1